MFKALKILMVNSLYVLETQFFLTMFQHRTSAYAKIKPSYAGIKIFNSLTEEKKVKTQPP